MFRTAFVLFGSLALAAVAFAQPAREPDRFRRDVVEPRTDLAEEAADVVKPQRDSFPPVGKPVAYEIAIIHLGPVDDFSDEERSVTGDNVVEAIAKWTAQGKVAHRSTFRLSSLEHLPAMVQIGQNVPIATGRTMTASRGFSGRGAEGGASPGGFAPRAVTSYSMADVGTMVKLTGRIDGENVIVEVSVEESSVDAPAKASDEDEGDFAPAGRNVLQMQTSVTVPNGGVVILSGAFRKSETTGEKDSTATIVTLSARKMD